MAIYYIENKVSYVLELVLKLK